MTQRSEITLGDLNQCAFLLSNGGFSFERAERTSDPRRMAFVIAGDEAVAKTLLEDFFEGSATVRVESFLAAQKRLKDIVHRGPLLRPVSP